MTTKVLGAFAEYLLIPARIADLNVFLKPDKLSFEAAALLEPLSCVAQGILQLTLLGAIPTEHALVVGPGAIGLMFVVALLASGVQRVSLAGRNEARLAVGEKLGAEVGRWPDGLEIPPNKFDVVVECTGQVEVWEKSVEFARRGGAVMLFGGPPGGSRAAFATDRLHYDQITLISPFHFGTEAVRLAYRWVEEGAFELNDLISGVRGLEEGWQTFEDLIAGRGIKYAFMPNGDAR
jgi:L-iditol 2-dehydrogenase